MDAEKAAQLRAPFPRSAIGKLPKGGAMLDYVGHAATTSRLLEVDPSWTWEPLALDEAGLPLFDHKGGLWIRLTICGVTRLGYGDGMDPKVRIGDALRNAAMRFGVALDLWAKEDISAPTSTPDDAMTGTVTRSKVPIADAWSSTPALDATAKAIGVPRPQPAKGPSDNQMRAMNTRCREAGVVGPDHRGLVMAALLELPDPVVSLRDLTFAQASAFMDATKDSAAFRELVESIRPLVLDAITESAS